MTIHAVITGSPQTPEFAPFLLFPAVKSQVLQHLLKPEFGPHISLLTTKIHTTAAELFQDLLLAEKQLGYVPTGRNLALVTTPSTTSTTTPKRGNFNGRGSSNFRGTSSRGGSSSRGRPAPYQRPGFISRGPTHPLQSADSRPSQPCLVCGRNHWTINCSFSPTMEADILSIPFPPNGNLIPFQLIKNQLKNHPTIQALYQNHPVKTMSMPAQSRYSPSYRAPSFDPNRIGYPTGNFDPARLRQLQRAPQFPMPLAYQQPSGPQYQAPREQYNLATLLDNGLLEFLDNQRTVMQQQLTPAAAVHPPPAAIAPAPTQPPAIGYAPQRGTLYIPPDASFPRGPQ